MKSYLEQAFGRGDVTSARMQAAIREWLNLYYGTQSPGEDAADRLAVLVVSKLCRTVFAEYESRTAEALAPLELTARKGKGGTLSGGIWTWDGSIWAACVPPEGSLVTVERAVLRQYRNGAPEWGQSLPVEHGRLEADVSDFQRQTRVEAGDEVLLLVEAVDSLGRTCTRQVEGAAFSDGPSGLEWAAFP